MKHVVRWLCLRLNPERCRFQNHQQFARLTLLLLLGIHFGADAAHAIDLHHSLSEVRPPQVMTARPVVVVFGSVNCGWCRKLELQTLDDPELELSIGDRCDWVQLDTEEDAELAERYEVKGVPHTVVIDANDRPLASRSGFMTTTAMVKFVEGALANSAGAQPVSATFDGLLHSAALLAPLEHQRQAAELLTALADTSSSDQSSEAGGLLREQVLGAGRDVWPVLVTGLTSSRLRVRAACAALLNESTQQELPFDPFASPKIRHEQAGIWRVWVNDTLDPPVSALEPQHSQPAR